MKFLKLHDEQRRAVLVNPSYFVMARARHWQTRASRGGEGTSISTTAGDVLHVRESVKDIHKMLVKLDRPTK